MESSMVTTDSSTPIKTLEELAKPKYQDGQMTSSIVSLTSSLTSPVDSGVQLLDSESEITSLMSTSGTAYDFDSTGGDDGLKDEALKEKIYNKQTSISRDSSVEHQSHLHKSKSQVEAVTDSSSKSPQKVQEKEDRFVQTSISVLNTPKAHVMTKSDIDNHNVHHVDVHASAAVLTTSCAAFINAFKHEETQELEEVTNDILKLEPILITEPKQSDTSDDLMNISLNSYELLDYTLQNIKPDTEVPSDMHVSMSEEVKEESSVLNMPDTVPENETEKPLDDQIVFRRQRRKKSKSDTPKKRVSFHEDILNSTKIDDIHINHGFITHEPDISMSFFERGFMRKPDVVKGRYSWAAEGDTPYYQNKTSEREVKSDIYVNRARVFSTSSSSSASISSSIDEEDSGSGNQNSDDNFVKKEPATQKLPKSSCLKKTKSNKKYIDTNIVEEETNLRKKKSESNLLDANIFGSLKNIFSFSTSVPLAERGVPEGQEDITVYSSSDTGLHTKYMGNEFASPKTCDGYEVQPAPVTKIGNLNLELAKTNLKLTKSEGFYPNYPTNQNLPNNIIICDSNVYEHKGISYSYEFENFQKTFEQQNKPKSSTIYQMLLNELNFFKKKEKKAIEKEAKENMEFYSSSVGKDTKQEEYFDDKSTTSSSIRKYASSATIDFSDNEMNWDFSDITHTRHLNSPKRRANRNSAHYSFKTDSSDDKLEIELLIKPPAAVKASSSKTSLINRFLRNVTMKKMIDLRLQKKQKLHRQYLPLYVKNAKANPFVNKEVDLLLDKEIVEGRKRKRNEMSDCEGHVIHKFKTEIFRSAAEVFVGAFPVYSAYTTTGESKPLVVVLSNTTLYIANFRPNSSYCNHFVLPYTELNTVLIGPNAQTIHISNYDKDMQCMISTGSESITNSIIKHVEIAMRKDINKPNLLAVKQLTMQDMVNLRKAICKQTVVLKGEEYFYYCVVNIQDYNTDAYETPLGPSKEGPLMFKTAESDSRWETAYFILKAGILYMLSSPSHRLPMRVLPLINGACQGARRVYNCTRPHTFQIQVGVVTLHLAAPDEYVASEWLQSLVHAASKTYGNREKMPAQSCSLLMTSEHILTIREAFPCTLHSSLGLREHQPIKGAQTLSCASIADITSFKLPCAEQSWCILEFACREVHETSGDWIIYFTTNSELEKFISTLEMLWTYHNEGESFPLSTIPETDILSKKCTDTYNMIQNAWVSLQVNLKSF